MKAVIIFLISGLVISCSSNKKINRIIGEKTNHDTTARVYSLLDTTNKLFAYYITPGGRKVLLQKIEPEERGVIIGDSVVTSMAPAGAGVGGASADDQFTGSIRATVKTTYSTAADQSYATIRSLYSSLESKTFMDGLNIGHSDSRVMYEDRNVIVRKAYLYTITIENDNDFHLLIGTSAVYDPATTRVFNAEVPGVPATGSAATKQHIRDLRAKLLTIFNGIPVCGRNGYLQQYTQIYISGSLFYDTQHKTNPAKCREVEGESAWEIHPVWDIRKLN
ncbi:MAG: hypothetical protein ABI741_06335 [Ferruginibacter sp.]